jgi:cytoskeletal protein RodZ
LIGLAVFSLLGVLVWIGVSGRQAEPARVPIAQVAVTSVPESARPSPSASLRLDAPTPTPEPTPMPTNRTIRGDDGIFGWPVVANLQHRHRHRHL